MGLNYRPPVRFVTILVGLLIVSIACQNPIPGIMDRNDSSSSPAATAEPVIIIVEGDDPLEIETVPEEQKSLSPVSSGQGITRANPYPIGTRISLPGWEIEVLDLLRAEAALAIINTQEWQAPVLPAGEEYAAARLFVRCTSMDDQAHSLGSSNVPITGSSGRTYMDNFDGFPAPEKRLKIRPRAGYRMR